MSATTILSGAHATAAEAAQVRDTPASAWLMAASALLLGVGTAASSLDVGTILVVLSLAVAAVALLVPEARALAALSSRSVVTLLAVGTVVEILAMAVAPPVADVRFAAIVLATGMVALHALLFATRWRTTEFAIVVIAHVALMSWMIAVRGPPDIDVYVFQQEGSAALLDGQNPYGLRFANTAPPGSPYYAPEVIDGDRFRFGFIYPPLSLLMALPGYAIAGDYRYAGAFAVGLTAWLLGRARPSRIAIGAALLVLFAPVTPRVLFWGWTDPFVIVLLATSVYLAVRQSSHAPIALGLLLAVKQYAAPALLLAVVLLDDLKARIGWRRLIVVPMAIALLTVLPFLAWDAASFIYSTITMHSLQPFRADSLSVPALLARHGFDQAPAWAGFIAGAIALLIVLLRAPRTVATFCGALALVLMPFFLFGKQAFMHYYFLPQVSLALGVAVTSVDRSTHVAARPAAP
jgi:hypothetical protein